MSSKPSNTAAATNNSLWREMCTAEDWWAIWCAGLLLIVSFAAIWFSKPENWNELVAADETPAIVSPLKPLLDKPQSWSDSALDAFYKSSSGTESSVMPGIVGVFVTIASLFALAMWVRGKSLSGFLIAFPVVFLLATCAYVLSKQAVVSAYNLEYALWALGLGLLISNTIGTPSFVRPAVLTEFYIKTGLVLLGAEVLMSRLLSLGVPGIFVAWVVTPIVLVSTYLLGQRVLKIRSKSLNMVISADMSVCGVSAAIATAAACKAKKEELTLAIGMSLSFTVVMMVVMPMIIKALGIGEVLGGAWDWWNDRRDRALWLPQVRSSVIEHSKSLPP